MRRFLKRIVRLTVYWYYWGLDYIYVLFWQIAGFFRRGDATAFLHSPQSEREPVIIIPGIYERWNFMKPVVKKLYHAGYDVHIIEGIGYNSGKVENVAKVISGYADEHNLRNSIIVARSKGGLVGKYLLTSSNSRSQFTGMVAISTPFAGSVYARLLPLSSLRVFAPHSPLLSLLAKNREVNGRIVSIYGRFDPHIPGGSLLEGATNIRLPVYGHFRTIKDKRVHREVLRSVRRLAEKTYNGKRRANDG